MKYFIIIALFAALLAGCSDKSKINYLEAENLQLTRDYENLLKAAELKNEFIEEYTSTINAVYDKLESIRERERFLDSYSRNPEKASTATIRERLTQNLDGIDQALKSGKKELAQLKEKLYASRMHSVSLEASIGKLDSVLAAKENFIGELKSEMGMLSEKIKTAEAEISEQASVIEMREDELNTAYIAIGSAGELKKLGIIEERGGILGLRKTKKLAANFNDENFAATDIDKTGLIPIDEKRENIRIISPHQADSYVLRDSENEGAILEILDPGEFWKIKYLVIMTKS